jgi:uncharacterized sulfatase
LIVNLKHDQEFTNACTRSAAFQSMVAAAEAGDRHAAEMVRRYQYRPAVEFYDLVADPLEMNNLAGDPQQDDTIQTLRDQLDRWMRSQGDRGIETELSANDHKKPQARKKANR